jgi:serine/threonine protein kinase
MSFPTSVFVRSGRFTDVEEIGQGAFGKVYYAKDNLGRAVAVKEARPTSDAFQDARARFEKEARLQAMLQHPNIVAVYHLEEDPETRELYLISEYANGRALADYIEEHGTITEQEAIKIGLDICAALEFTASKQMIHRDIKPSNILLVRDAREQITVAKLGDFGVAQDRKATHTTIAYGASHPGTPAYMAPEQANSATMLDVRADIYALGITLWEMLAGVDYKPLLSQTSAPHLQDYNRTASAAIAAVIQKAVQHDPANRYPTPRAMAEDLRAVLAGKQPTHSTASPAVAPTAISSTAIVRGTPRRPSPLRLIPVLGLLAALLAGGALVAPGLLTRSDRGETGGPSGSEVTAVLVAVSQAPTPTLIPAPPTPTALPSTATSTPIPHTATVTAQATFTPVPPTPTPIPLTSTPALKPGTVLYQADWSSGLNGWAGSEDWKTVRGMLVDDGTNSSRGVITAPYQLGSITDYAVEAQIQVVRGIDDGFCSESFGALVRTTEEGGYLAGAGPVGCSNAFIASIAGRNGQTLQVKSFTAGTDWHTYRVEVRGNAIRLLVDGVAILETVDNRYLAGGQVGLASRSVVLNVRGLKVIKL